MLTLGPAKIEIFSIINITPDSFSDGGKFLDFSKVKAHIELNTGIVDCWDFGAESTAPFNQAISERQELDRLEKILYPILDSANIDCISIDTYKTTVMTKVIEKLDILNNKPKRMIWNDVSGVFDQQTEDLLDQYPQLEYIYCHNMIPAKELTSHHCEYIDNSINILEHVKNDFSLFLSNWENKFGSRKLYLDPCFGFAKSREQNHILLNNLPQLIAELPSADYYKWLVGISRKSFLRFPFSQAKDEQTIKKTEIIEAIYWFDHIFKFANQNLSIRIHDYNVLSAICDYLELTNRKTDVYGSSKNLP